MPVRTLRRSTTRYPRTYSGLNQLQAIPIVVRPLASGINTEPVDLRSMLHFAIAAISRT